jgi:hypothetical protein
MKFAIVHFEDENTVAIVPCNWLQDDCSCLWPPFRGVRLERAVINMHLAEKSWKAIQRSRVLHEYGITVLQIQSASRHFC